MRNNKPVVYIASPYSKGDPAINTRCQCKMFDRLMSDGLVWPVAPLWSHFQHIMFPRLYADWVTYDLALLPRYDAVLRMDAIHPETAYIQIESSGADREVITAKANNLPVFYRVGDLYQWAERFETEQFITIDGKLVGVAPQAHKVADLLALVGKTPETHALYWVLPSGSLDLLDAATPVAVDGPYRFYTVPQMR
jgi:hypothetical protein